MNRTCVIVADGGIARFYGIEEIDAPRVKARLVERAVLDSNVDLKVLGQSLTGRPRTETNTSREAGPVHPIGAQRERHRVELERRFGQEIVSQAARITADWKEGVVVLVSEPRMLGLIREPLRKALDRRIELKELAKDYTHLTASALLDHLALNQLVPAARRNGQ